MTTQPTSGGTAGTEAFASGQPGAQRTSGNLLATEGFVVGIELSSSGARQSVALADLNGTILHRVRRPLEYAPDTQTVLGLLDEMIAEVAHPDRLRTGRNIEPRILRVGVAVGGLVEAREGLVKRFHHTPGWINFPLQDYFAEKLGAPCIIDNNANAAALGEYVRGVGQGERGIFYVGLGRGIGGGLVINGRIFRGATCTAGEIGHFFVKEDGPICSCGQAGHLEAIASVQAIVRTMLDLSSEYPETAATLQRVTEGDTEHISVDQIFRLAEEGDPIAQRVVHDVYHYLGMALTNIVHLVNPSMIILGGPGSSPGERLIAPLRERIQKYCLPEASQSLRIVQSALGPEANLLGAVTLALQDL
ncbi:ROK family protein [Dictyobacter arantiisoli]|uniref:Transcriptional regulator n=1 Tax=Dictyobacter arantiisoli TaxID=2014874 RepID=A0A5A5T6Z6_9CHLR|nr:ROK family protein [Dictyobacter arantiisoli]GCF06714.1 transcriptional regulator [Dictyobacter arantiisoli]